MFIVFVFVIASWIFSLCLHEYSHARVAYAGGDVTVAATGYLSFNPLRYVHPVLSILLPILFIMLGGLGLPGGAVWINTALLRSAKWKSAVSLAGPAANVAMCVALGVPFLLGFRHEGSTSVVWGILAFSCFLQATSVVLNLLPLPGLDGYGALEPWLPRDLAHALIPLRQYGFWILLIIANRTHGSFIYGPSLWMTDALHVPREAIVDGLRAFRFWEG